MLRKETVSADTLELLNDLMQDENFSCWRNSTFFTNRSQDKNPFLTLKALMYHQDINFQEPINMVTGTYSWKIIEKRLDEMSKSPARIFKSFPVS
jgi:hypothetical protein